MLIWADGFDHYGEEIALLEQGPYAEVNLTELSTDSRTGGFAARIFGITSQGGGLRRIIPVPVDGVGIGHAFKLYSLPRFSWSNLLAQFRDEDNVVHCSISISTTGQLVAWRGQPGSGVELGRGPPAVLTGSYQHFECFCLIGEGTGAMEARINGVTVLNVAGVDNRASAKAIGQVLIGGTAGGGGFSPMLVDDLFAWDSTGASNSDFIGDKKVYTLLPNADGADQDWTPSAGGDGYPMIDNVPPVDGSEYIYADDPGLRSTFGFSNLPEDVVSVAGVVTATRIWKTDAGDAKVNVGMISGASEQVGSDHALSLAPTYYHDVYEVDPATGLPWLPSAVDSAQSALERIE